MIAIRNNVVVARPVEIDIDVEHCLWAASAGLQPIDVIAALGMRWRGSLPTWGDALLAVRVAAARIAAGEPRRDYPAAHRPALRIVAGSAHRRAA